MRTAKAALIMEPNEPFVIKEFPVVEPSAGYARMSLIASGVCGTDVHIHTGRLGSTPGQIIGHEFVGKIEAISQVDSEKYGLNIGDAVISDIAVPCGECLLCKTGDDANCVNMAVTNGGDPNVAPYFHGGYAQVSFAPAGNLIKLPERVDPVAATVFACPGPTAIHAFCLAEQANCNIKNSRVAVVQGLGPVGMFAVSYLAAMGIKHVIAITAFKDEKREALAKEMGATQVLCIDQLGNEGIKSIILELTDGLGADLVFEASGSPKAVPAGMDMLRNRGVYLVPGQYSNSGGIEIQPQMITFKALHIIGSSQYSMCDVKKYVQFLAENEDLVKKIRTLATCYKVEDVNRAFSDAKSAKNVKTLLVNDL